MKTYFKFSERMRKIFNYFSIFTIVIGSIFGTINTANAAALTLTQNSTNGTDGINGTATLDVTGADTVDVADFDLVITNVEDSATALIIGAITGTNDDTDTTPELGIVFDEDNAAVAQIVTVASVTFTGDNDGAGLIDIDAGDAAGTSGTINFTGNVDTGTTGGGALGAIEIDFADSSATTPVLTINFGGDVTGTTTFDEGAEDVTLVYNGSAAQTITGTINSDGGAGEGNLNITNTGGTVTFGNTIGDSQRLGVIDLTAAGVTATFSDAVTSSTVTNTGTATFSSTLTATNINIETTGTATFTGRLITQGTSELDLAGAAIATVGFGHTTAGSSNTIDLLDLDTTSVLILDDTITDAMFVFGEATTTSAENIASGSKIYMPVNLTNGQTVNLTKTDGGGDVDTAVNTALQDTSLITYDSAEAGATVTVTATEVGQTTVESNLGVTSNKAKALSQAYQAAINDTVADSGAEDAFFNALNALNGSSATADTTLAEQVAPQTDMISGSTFATQAMTGSLQGIMSNRMAALRSGDAYATGMSAGSLSANSGFVQLFATDSEQKNTTVGSGTKFGYDASSSGIAIGFDGIADNGSVVGLSISMTQTDVDGKGTGKSVNDIDSYTASIYVDNTTDVGYVEGSLTVGLNENNTSRIVNTGGLDRTLKGDYDSDQISLKIGGGVPNEVGTGFVTPFGSLTATRISTDPYTETSSVAGDNLRLRVAQDDVDSTVGTVGLKYHTELGAGGIPMISLAINNEFGDNKINSTNTYQGGGSAFTTSTDVEELSATLGLGYSFNSDVASVEFAYEADANDDKYLSHYGSLKIVGKF